MPPISLPRQKRGKAIKAELLNSLAEATERNAALGVAAPASMTTVAGVPRIQPPDSGRITVRIVARGSGAFYSWQEIYPTSGGNYADGLRSGTTTQDNALELNGNTAVDAGTRTEIWLVNGQWVFQVGACNPTAKAQPIPPPVSNYEENSPLPFFQSRQRPTPTVLTSKASLFAQAPMS